MAARKLQGRGGPGCSDRKAAKLRDSFMKLYAAFSLKLKLFSGAIIPL